MVPTSQAARCTPSAGGTDAEHRGHKENINDIRVAGGLRVTEVARVRAA